MGMTAGPGRRQGALEEQSKARGVSVLSSVPRAPASHRVGQPAALVHGGAAYAAGGLPPKLSSEPKARIQRAVEEGAIVALLTYLQAEVAPCTYPPGFMGAGNKPFAPSNPRLVSHNKRESLHQTTE
jgi:hypothetical protein